MGEVGIEYQTVLGYPPVEFVHLAADLGCHGTDLTDDLASLDVMWELGATRANVVTMDAVLAQVRAKREDAAE
jgi:hypothetical protein